jgi:hypothetical protein
MESLKEAWNKLGRGIPHTKNPKGRPLKDDYAAALGRVEVFQHLM